MEDLLKIIVGVLGTIIVAGGSLVVSYFKSLQKKLEALETDKKEKEAKIQHLHNGFREEVNNRLINIEKQFDLIVKHLKGDKK